MNIHDFAENRGYNLRQIMDFTSAVNPLGLSNKAKHAIRKGIKYIPFPPDEKIRYLKRYICKKEHISEEQIIFLTDPISAMHAVINQVKPSTALVFSPVSTAYKGIFNGHDVKINTLPLIKENNIVIDTGELLRHINDADMILLSNPHDITGAILSPENLCPVIEETEKQGKMLIIDETYIEFSRSASPVKQVVESEKAVILRSFSAFHAMAGLPVAYGIGSTRLIGKIKDAGGFFTQVNALSYMAASASLKDRGYMERTLSFLKEEKLFIMDKIKGMDTVTVFDTPCNFLLLHISQPADNLEELFLQKNILVDVYVENDGRSYLRMPVKTHKFNARFIKTLKNINNQLRAREGVS